MRKIILSSIIVSMIFSSLPVFLSETEARPHPPRFHFWFHAVPFWVSPRVVIVHGDYGYLDLDVAPEEAKVYLNGQYIGICDQYDGFPNYLYLKQGTYTIRFALDGYADFEKQIVVLAGKELEFNTRLKKIKDSAQTEPRPEITTPVETQTPEPQNSPQPPGAAMVAFRIFPKDAAIYIDDQFVGVAGSVNSLENGVSIAPGPHTITILKPGYESYKQEIEVSTGETIHIRVILIQNASSAI